MNYTACGSKIVEAVYRSTFVPGHTKPYAFLAPDDYAPRIGDVLWAGQDAVEVVQIGSDYAGSYWQRLSKERR